MNAPQKMDAIGMKPLHELVEGIRPGTAIETLYRWRQALNKGQGISDARKQLLIKATANTEHPITWGDFHPAGAEVAS